MSEKYVSISKAAKLLGVHQDTVREWSSKGRLAVYWTTGGHRRFAESEIRAIADQTVPGAIEQLRNLMGVPEECVLCWISAEDGQKLSGSAMVLEGGALHLRVCGEVQ